MGFWGTGFAKEWTEKKDEKQSGYDTEQSIIRLAGQ